MVAAVISLGFFILFSQPFVNTKTNSTTLNSKELLLTWISKPLLQLVKEEQKPQIKVALHALSKKPAAAKVSAISATSPPAIQPKPETDTPPPTSSTTMTPPETLADPLAISAATTTAEPTLSASSALRINGRLNSAAVRAAYEASKTDIQKMAEKSGNSLEDPRLSKHDKFQQAANRAAKPDCLRQGGSLLSLFVVAYQVATDHCK